MSALILPSNMYNINSYQNSTNNSNSDNKNSNNKVRDSDDDIKGDSYAKIMPIQNKPGMLVNYETTKYSRYC